MTIERRFTSGQVEIRSAGQQKKVRGYAAVFGKISADLGGFREIIEPGAFDDVLNDDVRALFNHDPSAILARSKNGNGTLRIWTDSIGLGYEFVAPNTQAGRDLLVSLERGDVDQSSFGFRIGKDRWHHEKGDSLPIRTIVKVERLIDVSPVTFPAYPDATVALARMRQAGVARNASGPLSYHDARARFLALHPKW